MLYCMPWVLPTRTAWQLARDAVASAKQLCGLCVLITQSRVLKLTAACPVAHGSESSQEASPVVVVVVEVVVLVVVQHASICPRTVSRISVAIPRTSSCIQSDQGMVRLLLHETPQPSLLKKLAGHYGFHDPAALTTVVATANTTSRPAMANIIFVSRKTDECAALSQDGHWHAQTAVCAHQRGPTC